MENKNNDLSSLKIDRSSGSRNPGTKKKITIAISVIIIAALAVAGYTYISPMFDSTIDVSMTSAALQTPAQSSAVLTASGYVVAQRKAAVASKGTGRLVYLGVVEGDKVKKGEIIARLEDDDVKAQLAAAKANLELQQADLTQSKNAYYRAEALFKTNAVSQADLDQAQANYNRVVASIAVAKANVQGAEVALENTVIRAPFDGTVLTKNADVGEIVAPLAAGVNSKAAVVTIADMKSLQVEADVSESNIERITPDQKCEIVLDAYPGQSYPAYVSKVVPTADRTKATVMVKVGFRNYDSRVLPEMSAKVLFLSKDTKETAGNQQPLLVVPSSSIVERNGQKVVFEVKSGEAVQVPVSTGRQFDSYTGITSGLNNGDQVIANPGKEIKDGVKVKVQ